MTAQGTVFQDLSRFRLPEGFRGRPAWFVQLWWCVQALFFRLSPQFCFGWRRFLLRLFGARIGDGVMIRPTVTITYPWKLAIGNDSWVGDDVVLYTLGEIKIGDNCVVSQRSYLCTGSHDMTDPCFPIFAKSITLESQTWIAADVFVAPGVMIGKGTVIGARSSVFSDQPSGMLCLGNPAKPIRSRIPGDSHACG